MKVGLRRTFRIGLEKSINTSLLEVRRKEAEAERQKGYK